MKTIALLSTDRQKTAVLRTAVQKTKNFQIPKSIAWGIWVNFVLLPERLTLSRFAPSALNLMRFSKALSAYSPHPFGHLRVLLLRSLNAFPVNIT